MLVFTNSSHGTYLADEDGDEPRFDEAMCPWDCDDRLLVDDELRDLFDDLPAGVRGTIVSDSCHSGSVTRALPPEFGPTPDNRRVRFLNPRRLGLPELPAVGVVTSAKHASRGATRIGDEGSARVGMSRRAVLL